jgi:polyhydroxyalkanoate synthesis regulator phasin
MAWNLMLEELERQRREAQHSTGPQMDRLRAQLAQLEREADEMGY